MADDTSIRAEVKNIDPGWTAHCREVYPDTGGVDYCRCLERGGMDYCACRGAQNCCEDEGGQYCGGKCAYSAAEKCALCDGGTWCAETSECGSSADDCCTRQGIGHVYCGETCLVGMDCCDAHGQVMCSDGECAGTEEECCEREGRVWCGYYGCVDTARACCSAKGWVWHDGDCCAPDDCDCLGKYEGPDGCQDECTENGPCGCGGHYNADCHCVGDTRGNPCGCAASGQIVKAGGVCHCSKPLIGDPCGCHGTVGTDCDCTGDQTGDPCGCNGHKDSNCDCIGDQTGYPCGCNGYKDSDCNCIGDETGQSCGCGGHKLSNCLCSGDQTGKPCGCHGHKDSNCNCVGDETGYPCGCNGYYDSLCNCLNNEEGDPCTIYKQDDGYKDADCDCICHDYGKAACEANNGTWNHDGCHCVCKTLDQVACQLKAETHYWNPDTCACPCRNGKSAKACEDLGGHHFWDDDACECKCDNKDPLCGAGSDVYHRWNDTTCTCDCIDLPESAAEDCTRSKGTWDEATCHCTCQEGKELGGDKGTECVCVDFMKKAATCDKYNPGGWDNDACTCDCGEKRTWDVNKLDCTCDDREAQALVCEAKGLDYVDEICDCGCKTDSATKAIATFCDLDEYGKWDHRECKCDCEGGRTYHMTEGYDGECQCDGSQWNRAKEDCRKKEKLDWRWDNHGCKCFCSDEIGAHGKCTVGDYSQGYIQNCECHCPSSVIGTKGPCNDGATLDSGCKCQCDDPAYAKGTKCTIRDKDDGEREENCGKCKCKASSTDECKIMDSNAGVQRDGHKDPDTCGCICDEIGDGCTYKKSDGTTMAGKVGEDCQCVCLLSGQWCSEPGIPYGKYTDNCACACAPEGTKCQRPDGSFGKVVNNPSKGECDCVCDDIKGEEECEAKANETDAYGNLKPWKWNKAGCSCDCLDAGYTCTYYDSEGEIHTDGIINETTCECEPCKKTAVTCIFPAIPNAGCVCDCTEYEQLVGPCPKGQRRIPDLGCKCGCDEDIDEESCAAKPHEGEDGDTLVPNSETCSCVCNNGGAECDLPGGGKGTKNHDTCKCECDAKKVAATCVEGEQVFNSDKCKCECDKEHPCTDGTRWWERPEPDCKCACQNTRACQNGGKWIPYQKDGKGCYCDCTNATWPPGTNQDFWKMDEVCKPYCNLAEVGCDWAVDYNWADCDCSACKDDKCAATPATPDLNPYTCDCECNESDHDTSCGGSKKKEWSAVACACIDKQCDRCEEKGHNEDCEYCDCDENKWKGRTSGPWHTMRAQFVQEVTRNKGEIDTLLANFPTGSFVCPSVTTQAAPSGIACAYCYDRNSSCFNDKVISLRSECNSLRDTVISGLRELKACSNLLGMCITIANGSICGEAMPTGCSCSAPPGIGDDIDRAKSLISQLNDLKSYTSAAGWGKVEMATVGCA